MSDCLRARTKQVGGAPAMHASAGASGARSCAEDAIKVLITASAVLAGRG